jgi:hypothetical protein
MAGSPINEIMQMRKQGLSNNQVIQNLQREGYTNTQIFDAMNQADTKMAVEGVTPAGNIMGNEQMQAGQQSMEQGGALFTEPPQNAISQPQESQGLNLNEPTQSFNSEQVKVEELVEAIIEEKWEELLRDVNKIVSWKNKVESRISEIEVKVDHLKENFSDLQKAVIGKVNDYDQHILEVGSEIKAMEKVFSKVLPMFTENVSELNNIANKLKGVEGQYEEE